MCGIAGYVSPGLLDARVYHALLEIEPISTTEPAWTEEVELAEESNDSMGGGRPSASHCSGRHPERGDIGH